MSIHTPRLILRRPALGDLDAIHAAKVAMWPELQKWMSWASDDEAGIDATRAFITGYATSLCGFDRHTGAFVVSSGCDPVKAASDYSTGYWVAREYLGMGYATEATNAVLRYAFESLNATAVHISHYEGNDKSRRVIEKLGFEFTETKQKAYLQFSSGERLDEHCYVRRNAHHLPGLEVAW